VRHRVPTVRPSDRPTVRPSDRPTVRPSARSAVPHGQPCVTGAVRTPGDPAAAAVDQKIVLFTQLTRRRFDTGFRRESTRLVWALAAGWVSSRAASIIECRQAMPRSSRLPTLREGYFAQPRRCPLLRSANATRCDEVWALRSRQMARDILRTYAYQLGVVVS